MRPKRRATHALWSAVWLPIFVAYAQTSAIDHVDLLPHGPHHIGDRLELRIVVTTPHDQHPEVAIPHGRSAELVWGTPVSDPSGGPSQQGAQTWLVRCPVQVFIVGDTALPALDVGVGQEVLHTPPVPIKVDSVRTGADAEVLRDILPPVRIERPRWWVPALAALLAFASGAVLFVAYRARNRPAVVEGPPHIDDAPSPEQWLADQFERLGQQRVRSAEELRRFVARIADVVREYLALKAGIPALQRTTTRTLEVARSTLPAETTAQLERLLTAADRVKFARETPAADAARAHLDHARDFCRELEYRLAPASPTAPTRPPRADTSA